MLGDRLTRVAEYIKGERLADIGSDHAYLPIACIEKEIIKHAIAGEVVEGPFQAAVKNVAAYQMNDKIEVRKGSGLEVISCGEVDCITICGMGGPLIADILDQGQTKLMDYPRLVLQSNIHTQKVREMLMQLGYQIIDEAIIKEKKHIYEIVVAEKGEQQLTQQQLKFGPILIQEKNDWFIEKWQRELNHLTHVKTKLSPESSEYQRIDQQLQIFEGVL